LTTRKERRASESEYVWIPLLRCAAEWCNVSFRPDLAPGREKKQIDTLKGSSKDDSFFHTYSSRAATSFIFQFLKNRFSAFLLFV
jgi:hypothetical protein